MYDSRDLDFSQNYYEFMIDGSAVYVNCAIILNVVVPIIHGNMYINILPRLVCMVT